ncbi:DeoR/GlpR family DNA-binding transcription regulator [Stieleria sp. JC731]|uniref:DeoR/GlpR family DNA-binding transcription regulator n=1 Tax=Pirellulaceae TaxID=2691357 RepID=UPI001E60D40D|nr:DeoR/GlpR family DNA-binding transcription regulator [Stieleria sp. JC731]MCC9603089.1 DeoR/GlpR family DNA-binding transcription regulator [Stieleria sp. JC731]
MLATERRENIAKWIGEQGQASLDELSERFGVSTDTIRRDLAILHRKERVRQVRGGALRVSEDPFPYQRRAIRDLDEKRAIAEEAASKIPKGSVVFLDHGTTALCVAETIASRNDLTVVTSNLPAAVRLGEAGRVKTIVPGGRLDGEIQGLVGAQTCQQLRSVHFDVAVLVPRGISASGELTTAVAEDAEVKRVVRERSGRCLILAAEKKLGVQGAFQFADLENGDVVLSNADDSHKVIANWHRNFPAIEIHTITSSP